MKKLEAIDRRCSEKYLLRKFPGKHIPCSYYGLPPATKTEL